jgi:hypothetical protein
MGDRAAKQLASNGEITSAREAEQSERIADLMDTVLIVEQRLVIACSLRQFWVSRDIDAYNKSFQRAFRFKTQPDKERKKRTTVRRVSQRKKLSANFSALIYDLAPRRYSVTDRFTDEICYRLNQMPVVSCVKQLLDLTSVFYYRKIVETLFSSRCVT